MKDKSFDMYIVQGSDLPSGNGRVLPLVAKPLDAHDSHPASGGGSHSYVGLDKAMVVAIESFMLFSVGRDVSNPPCLSAKKSWGQYFDYPCEKYVCSFTCKLQ